MSDVFARWNTGVLDSYLIEITRDILGYVDPETNQPLVDSILDTAGQKGTGKWTVVSAMDTGTPLTLISEAVFSRCLSAQKDQRVHASTILSGPKPTYTGDRVDGERNGLEVQQIGYRPDVAWWLHHPEPIPWQYQGSV
jgi:6-phosphogluconate dehydrogenase